MGKQEKADLRKVFDKTLTQAAPTKSVTVSRESAVTWKSAVAC